MKLKRKLFGDKGIVVGGLAGLTGGALLGNELHAQYDALKARRSYNPEEEARKKEKAAEIDGAYAKSLRENKDYMKRFKSAKKKRDEVYRRFDNGKAEEWELNEADSKFDSEVPEGDVERYENYAQSDRKEAEEIRKNPEKYRNQAARNAKLSRRLNPTESIGTKIGGVIGGVLGAGIGVRS